MLRPIFIIGLFALGGLFLLKLFFGLFGGLFVLAFMLLRFAITVAIVGAIVYLIIRVVSPETARRLASGSAGRRSKRTRDAPEAEDRHGVGPRADAGRSGPQIVTRIELCDLDAPRRRRRLQQ